MTGDFSTWEWRKAVRHRTDLSLGVKNVANEIAEGAPKSKVIFGNPARYETIAEGCGMTESGVRKAIAALVREGYLEVKKRGFGEPNTITLRRPQSVPARTDWEAANPPRPGRTIRPARDRQSVPTGTVYVREQLNNTKNNNRPLPRPDDFQGEIPDGLVRKADPDSIVGILGGAACRLLGINHPSEKIDGHYPDRWILAKIDAEILDELTRRCVAGTLSRADLLLTLHALGIAAEVKRLRRAA